MICLKDGSADIGLHGSGHGSQTSTNILLRPPPLTMDIDLKLPGQPIQVPHGPAPQLSNGVYSRGGQVRASLVGTPIYQASVRIHQSTVRPSEN